MNAYIPLFAVPTPYAGIPLVTLHKHVWEQHILVNHPDLAGREEWILRTLKAPSVICAGTTNPHHVAFVNRTITSQRSHSLLTVFVHPDRQTVVSAAYRNDFRDTKQQRVLWVPTKDSE